jgi:[ribosomal protein S18]-alanine N-acetyltransferase
MKTAIIRCASRADLPSILAIGRTSPAAAQWQESEYTSAVDSPARLLLVAEQNSEVVGFAFAFTAIREWELENIAVHPGSREQGIGRVLMNALVGAAKAAGASEIRQEIRASNLPAQRLAQSCGFVQEGRRAAYYKQPVEEAILFKLSFTQLRN